MRENRGMKCFSKKSPSLNGYGIENTVSCHGRKNWYHFLFSELTSLDGFKTRISKKSVTALGFLPPSSI